MIKDKLKEYGVYAGKGFAIGALMTVPGVSGGTLALILDIYDRLLFAVATLFKDFKKNFIFLATVGFFGVLGMFVLSKGILWLSDLAPVPVRFFFIGAILGGIPMLYRKTGLKKFSILSLVFFLAGAATVLSLSIIPQNLITISGGFSLSQLPAYCISGIGLAVALIAPGISFSHMLLVLGIYDRFYEALSSFDIVFLASILIPMAIFTLLLIKIMELAMTKYPMQTYSAIIGFVIASIKDVYAGLPSGFMIIATVLSFIAGAALVFAITARKTE